MNWLTAGEQAGSPMAQRVLEALAGSGSAGVAGIVVKTGAIAVSAGALATGVGLMHHGGSSPASDGGSRPRALTAAGTPRPPRGVVPAVRPTSRFAGGASKPANGPKNAPGASRQTAPAAVPAPGVAPLLALDDSGHGLLPTGALTPTGTHGASSPVAAEDSGSTPGSQGDDVGAGVSDGERPGSTAQGGPDPASAGSDGSGGGSTASGGPGQTSGVSGGSDRGSGGSGGSSPGARVSGGGGSEPSPAGDDGSSDGGSGRSDGASQTATVPEPTGSS